MTRLIGAPNFRDLGGLPTADGRRLRRGRLFRSDVLSRLTEEDLERLAELDIRVICDLRGPVERSKEVNRWPPTQPVRTIAYAAEAALAGIKPIEWTLQLLDPAFDAASAHAAMVGAYKRMPDLYAGQIKELFAHLDSPDSGGVVIHCLAGKDRTGFVCAMLLSALGVPQEDIFSDYLLSRERFAATGRVAAMLKKVFGDAEIPPRASAAAAVVGGVDTGFLKTAIAELESAHGSVNTYLEIMTGLSAERRKALRSHLLA